MARGSSTLEILRFEYERTWTAPYLGLILALLIVSSPAVATPLNVEESALDLVFFSMGSVRPIIYNLITIVAFTNSFGMDIEQDVMMGEFTLPIKKGTFFVLKFLAIFLTIILMDLVSASFSFWLVSASAPLIPIVSIVLVDAITSLLFISIGISLSVMLRSRFGAAIVSLAIYFLEEIVQANLSLQTNSASMSPSLIILKLLLSNEVTIYTWPILLIHVGSASALLVFAYFFLVEVLQLD
ncbi:MAG: hypothetical protein JTT11_01655 [Candidatus Brockarchaeota archaeon]|nr:hypothetical protein [Candidatus Brockarchaeota archaeon]